MLTSNDIEWVILAGGQASRMGGIDKGLVNLKGKPLIEYVLSALSSQTQNKVINANRNLDVYQKYAEVITDHFQDFPGPLAGIHAGLSHAKKDWVGFVPCDSPYITPDCVSLFCQAHQEGHEILMAHDGDHAQPVFAVFHRCVLDRLQAFLQRGERKIILFYQECHVQQVDFSNHKETFINLNTLADIQALDSIN